MSGIPVAPRAPAQRRPVGTRGHRSFTACTAGRAAIAEQDRHSTPPQKVHRSAAPRRSRPARNDASAPAESVRVTDRPASPGSRAYLVERGLETKSELDALIADYLQQATKLDSPPLAVCPLENSPEANA
jgi:hypothetical protein